MKSAETVKAREARELVRREKQLQAKKNRFYMQYLFMVLFVLLPLIPKETFGYMYLGLTIPGLIGAIFIIWRYVGETRGLDLKKVTGAEWDKVRREK